MKKNGVMILNVYKVRYGAVGQSLHALKFYMKRCGASNGIKTLPLRSSAANKDWMSKILTNGDTIF